ncbi:hypothetical protein AAA799P11_00752 [Marine Group I thaumarchaeote SCGC AAA799-P11]|uniref:Uncharacterized protein n=1 Tax=Marine Group I thaumarchaeote SCGC AAA799-P11 TaxID=1502295 RepID=A0A087S124_9ARCH|nr:hypothetical protein AAA799P11_00752 [Marine Group I thaumarchaeote SCGC AAA799-P11]
MSYATELLKDIRCNLCLKYNRNHKSKIYKTKRIIFHLRTAHTDVPTYLIDNEIRKIKELIK